MDDVIHLLPDFIANQIAAGEVIQRPSSVVKELIENAVDAEASNIRVIIKDSGRSLIQVIDNGKGMSASDARVAFERHATSKIHNANDLLSLRTMGFRGEALASIAAVSQVELKTRRKVDEIGTLIQISASKIEKQEITVIHTGSSFSVKNLFFNVPARRKFLKSNEIEFKNILTEFEKIALVNYKIIFTLQHNNKEIILLPISNLKQRIANIVGKKITQYLLPIDINTTFTHIYGFISTPTSSKKSHALQYFFVNGRYVRNMYLHRAVISAFEPLIPVGEHPNYFIYIEIDPTNIDINIHPTKTEIKFENEQILFQVIFSAIKETLAVPSLEFDQENAINIPLYTKKDSQLSCPKIQTHSDYNPFKEVHIHNRYLQTNCIEKNQLNIDNQLNYNNKITVDNEKITYLQYKEKYLIFPLESGLAFINKRRAHIRILFDDYMQKINSKNGFSQKLLFPQMIYLTQKEGIVLSCILDDLTFIGFDIENLGNNTYSINGIPSELKNTDVLVIIQEIIDKIFDTGYKIKEKIREQLALILASKKAINYEEKISEKEMHTLISELFLSTSPNYTPDGKLIIFIFSEKELNRQFL